MFYLLKIKKFDISKFFCVGYTPLTTFKMHKNLTELLNGISVKFSIDKDELFSYAETFSKPTGRKCGGCGEYGHNKRTCPVIHPELANAKANEKPKSTKKCKYCGEYGHNKRTCLKRKTDEDPKMKHFCKTNMIKTNFSSNDDWLIHCFGENALVLHQDILENKPITKQHNILINNKRYLGFIKLNHETEYDRIFCSVTKLDNTKYTLILKDDKFMEFFTIPGNITIKVRLGKIKNKSKIKNYILDSDSKIDSFFETNVDKKITSGYNLVLRL